MPVKSGGENDMRFVYCACCVSYILDDWTGINVGAVLKFIKDSLVYCNYFSRICGYVELYFVLYDEVPCIFIALLCLLLMNKNYHFQWS